MIEVSSEEEATEIETIWRTYASIVPALDYLAARGIIEPKPEGASWANTLIVLTEKGRRGSPFDSTGHRQPPLQGR
jgi:hypothetical protein